MGDKVEPGMAGRVGGLQVTSGRVVQGSHTAFSAELTAGTRPGFASPSGMGSKGDGIEVDKMGSVIGCGCSISGVR